MHFAGVYFLLCSKMAIINVEKLTDFLYSYNVHVPIYPSTGIDAETATTKNMKQVKTRQRYLHRASVHNVRHDDDDDVHACVHVHIVTIFPPFCGVLFQPRSKTTLIKSKY